MILLFAIVAKHPVNRCTRGRDETLSNSCKIQRLGWAAATAHHHLIRVNLEPRRRFRVPHFDLIPGDIVDPAGFFGDEVVMTIRVRIEEHRVGSEMQLPKQPPLNEECASLATLSSTPRSIAARD